MRHPVPALVALFALSACSDVEDGDSHGDHNHDVITTVTIALTPASGGAPVVATWADPEADGDPIIDGISLAEGEDYTLAIAFLNELEEPVEDVTAEIADQGTSHQVFVTGDGVEGPATPADPDARLIHTTTDADANGAPLGLVGTLDAVAAGAGTLTVTLRHLPPQDGQPVKTDTLADDVAAGGFATIPGDTDAQVDFDFTVQ